MPYYFPSSLENAIRFYRDVGEMFPKLNIMIYHNPALHHVTLPVEAFKEITQESGGRRHEGQPPFAAGIRRSCKR